MDRPSKRRDNTKENVNAKEKQGSEKWKKSSLYGVPTDKHRPKSTLETARESTSKLVRESTSETACESTSETACESTSETACESTSKLVRESTPGPKDHIRYRDGRLRLAQQRQHAYSYITSNLSAGSIYRYQRLGSYGNDNNSNPSTLGVPKGDKGSTSPPVYAEINLTTLGGWGPDLRAVRSDSDFIFATAKRVLLLAAEAEVTL